MAGPHRIKKGAPNPNKAKRAKPNPPPRFVLGGLATGSGRGRPTVYQDTFPEVLKRLRLLNNTLDEIAKFFGVEPSTIFSWCEKYPDFNRAYAEGGDEADLEVIAALKHRARGYSHPAVKIMVVNGQVVREEYIEHYPPDTNAATLWLSNRQRGKWRLGSAAGEDPNTAAAAPQIQIVGGLPDE